MVDLNIKLPETFLLEEERDGYLVSAKMKQLWAVQLDLLNELDRVCKKYDLKYILDFGTLLGAVRHKGYIPWDDDIDVSMLREDYDKLMEIAPNEFKEPYFMQNRDTDKGYDISVTKLRRSDTTYMMTENTKHPMSYNQGIFIDIFVFDYLPSNDKDVLSRIGRESYEAFLHGYVLSHRPDLHDGIKLPATFLRYVYYKIKYGSAEKEFNRLEEIARLYGPSDYVGNIIYMDTRCRPLKWFQDVAYAPFEFLTLPIPVLYDDVLRERYGDYMTPVRGSTVHSLVFYDVNRSYKEYLLGDHL